MKEQLQIICSYYNITKTKLAETIGITKGAISHIMSDKNTGGRRLSDENVNNLLKAYPSISKEWLTTGIGEMFVNSSTDHPTLFGASDTTKVISISPSAFPIVEESKSDPHQSAERSTVTSMNTHTTSFQHSNDTNSIPESDKAVVKNAIVESMTQKNNQTPILQDGATRRKVMARIERIVIFYSDGTFSEHTPKE